MESKNVTKPARPESIREVLDGPSPRSPLEVPEGHASSFPDSLERSTLDALREMMGDDDYFNELVIDYIRNARTLVSEMTSGISDTDWIVVRRAAHTLSATSATFGGRRLSEWARMLEDEATQAAGERSGTEAPADLDRTHASESAADRLSKTLDGLRRESDRMCELLRLAI